MTSPSHSATERESFRGRGSLKSGRTPARLVVDDFISRNATNALTLDVGAGRSPYGSKFPVRIAVDIQMRPDLAAQATVNCLPFRDEAFGCVLATELLEHLPEPGGALVELHRVLAPGGKLILTTRFCYPIHNPPIDFYRYTRYGLEWLLRDGWEINSIQEDTDGLGTAAIIFNTFLREEKRTPLIAALLLAWHGIWRFVQFRARRQLSKHSLRASKLVPAGYLVVATRMAPK